MPPECGQAIRPLRRWRYEAGLQRLIKARNLVSKRKFALCSTPLPIAALTFFYLLPIIYLIKRANETVADSLFVKATLNSRLPSPEDASSCRDCIEDICSKFAAVANCQRLIDAKGDRHKLPDDLGSTSQRLLNLQRVVLVIHFNFEYYRSAPLVDDIYKSVFRKIIYCGPSSNDLLFKQHWYASQPNVNLSAVNFVPYGVYEQVHQVNPYQCLPLVLKVNEDVSDYDGVLLISDDAVLNYWNWKLPEMDLDKIWALLRVRPFDIIGGKFCMGKDANNSIDCQDDEYWPWPTMNKKEITSFYDELTDLANGAKQMDSDIVYNSTRTPSEWAAYWHRMKAKIAASNGGEYRLTGLSIGDMLYIGRRFLPEIAPVLDLMGRHHVFLEVAVGTAVQAVASKEDIFLLSFAGEDWGQGHIRKHPFIDSYSTSYSMVHPLKLSKLIVSLRRANAWITYYDVATYCVYCNLIKLSSDFATFLQRNATFHNFNSYY